MSVVDAEPLGIFLEVDRYFVFVGLPVDSFVGNGGVAFEMRGHVSADGIGNFRKFLGLFGWLLFVAFLAGVVEKGSLESLGDEVGIDAVFVDAGAGDNFLEFIAGVAWLDEGFFLFLLGLVFDVGGLAFDQRDVLRTLDSA